MINKIVLFKGGLNDLSNLDILKLMEFEDRLVVIGRDISSWGEIYFDQSDTYKDSLFLTCYTNLIDAQRIVYDKVYMLNRLDKPISYHTIDDIIKEIRNE